jgi:hypothetical protein
MGIVFNIARKVKNSYPSIDFLDNDKVYEIKKLPMSDTPFISNKEDERKRREKVMNNFKKMRRK